MRLRALVIAGILGAAGIVSAAVAQRSTLPPPAPITEELKLQVQLDLQQLELLQTKMQLLQQQFEATKASLQARLKGLERPGYDLNLQTFQYVKRDDAKK